MRLELQRASVLLLGLRQTPHPGIGPREHARHPSEDRTYLTVRLYRMLGRPSSALPLLERAIGTPIESGRIYGLLAEIYESNRRSDDARRLRQQGQRKFST